MAKRNYIFEVGLWYVVIYVDGTTKKFQFVGGEPPMVYVAGEGFVPLAQILSNYVKIESALN